MVDVKVLTFTFQRIKDPSQCFASGRIAKQPSCRIGGFYEQNPVGAGQANRRIVNRSYMCLPALVR